MALFATGSLLYEEIGGGRAIHKIGLSAGIDNVGYEDVWDKEGFYTFLTAAKALKVASSSAQDKPSGTGIGKIKVVGIDADGYEIEEEIELNGVSAVSSVKEFLRVNDVVCTERGSGNTDSLNAGIISIGNSDSTIDGSGAITAGPTLSYIKAGIGRDRQLIYTIPKGYRGNYVNRAIEHSATATDLITAEFLSRKSGEAWKIDDIQLLRGASGEKHDELADTTEELPEGTDIRARAKASAAGPFTVVAKLELVLTRNSI